MLRRSHARLSVSVCASSPAFLSRDLSPTTATPDVVANRTALIADVPALGDLLEASAVNTGTKLGYILSAVQFPDQLSAVSSRFAATYVLRVLQSAAINAEVCIASPHHVLVSDHHPTVLV